MVYVIKNGREIIETAMKDVRQGDLYFKTREEAVKFILESCG